jgi:hypothetical protein
MVEAETGQVQVITNELDYNPDFGKFLKNKDIYKQHGTDYRTVAVIGCQSSGKSKSKPLF